MPAPVLEWVNVTPGGLHMFDTLEPPMSNVAHNATLANLAALFADVTTTEDFVARIERATPARLHDGTGERWSE